MYQGIMDLIFFGRLEDEKGFDLILNILENHSEISKEFTFHICGKGKYEKRLKEIKTNNVNYYGWVDSDKLNKLINKSDFALMPSRFLETFGLSGLEALSKGVPVIGMGKGGCKKFIIDELDILNQPGTDQTEQLINILKKIKGFDKNKIKNLKTKSESIASNFTKQEWLEKFKKTFGSPDETKKVLLVSDFIVEIGGIEKYIFDIKKLLESQGYEVELFGRNYNENVTKSDKIIGMIRGIRNSKYANRLKKKIKDFEPDLVRYHSILRFLGWKSIAVSQDFDVKTAMMFHDFGYFYPFPSRLNHIDQIKDINFLNFIKMSKTYNPLVLFLVCIKYISIVLIKKQISQNIDINLVPSEFMESIVANSYNINEDKIKTLPHYIFE